MQRAAAELRETGRREEHPGQCDRQHRADQEDLEPVRALGVADRQARAGSHVPMMARPVALPLGACRSTSTPTPPRATAPRPRPSVVALGRGGRPGRGGPHRPRHVCRVAGAVAAAARLGVDLVRGVEISCSRGGVSVHLLGYLVDPRPPGAAAPSWNGARVAGDPARPDGRADGRGRHTRHRSRQVRAQSRARAPRSGRPHIADALVASRRRADRDEAFTDCARATAARYYVSHYAPDPVRAVRLVREAGGVPVMAHPFATRPRLDASATR